MNGLERLDQAKAEKREPTSLRFFCFRMANKKRAMALSLLGDMMAAGVDSEVDIGGYVGVKSG